jgi:hypothetical protein
LRDTDKLNGFQRRKILKHNVRINAHLARMPTAFMYLTPAAKQLQYVLHVIVIVDSKLNYRTCTTRKQQRALLVKRHKILS